jgi:peptide-methionine (S)-S-oxide reductase
MNQSIRSLVVPVALWLCAASCSNSEPTANNQVNPNSQGNIVNQPNLDKSSGETKLATFGAGCFWCVEAVFQELDGVISVKSGYAGGLVENPTYKQICTGKTGHAEVCQIQYDPGIVSFDQLLEVFWKTHDPTTLNQQGADQGTQYRSAVFYHDQQQKDLAESYKEKLNASGAFADSIVTEIVPFTKFFEAEDDHQNFFLDNPNNGYCRAVIQPKVDKFRNVFADKLKSDVAK